MSAHSETLAPAHRRRIPVSEAAPLRALDKDPRSLAACTCLTPERGWVCPSCQPGLYPLLAAAHDKREEERLETLERLDLLSALDPYGALLWGE